jgi:signal transduction histidine kinase
MDHQLFRTEEDTQQALVMLAAALAENPRRMLQRLPDVARQLCRADAAGVGLIGGATFTTTETEDGVSEAAAGDCLVVPFNDHGKAAGTLWIVSHDANRRFGAEEARLLGGLTHLASAAAQLWRANQAAGSIQRKDEFIAILGHELRNPLFALTMSSAALKAPGLRNEDRQLATAMIDRQIHHITRLVDDLLDMTRIENGKMRLDLRAVDLREIVRNTLESRRPEVERRKHRVTVEVSSAPVLVDGDPVRLVQVLSNLVDNAVKYTPEAGHITVAVTADGHEATVAVQDNGDGIPPDRVGSIFEPFVQLSHTQRDARGGMGLGLALVRRLTELHGGTVDASSAGEGRGSRFAVHLPMHVAPN